MIFAHLPSGYLLGRALKRRRGPVMWAALTGSIFPDFDLAWFYLVDHGAVFHHRYLTHIPLFWVWVAAIVLPMLVITKRPVLPAFAFLAAAMLHLVLDTLSGGILWLWPLSDRLIHLIHIPPADAHWIITFMRHPSFVAEIAIIAAATVLFFTPERRPT